MHAIIRSSTCASCLAVAVVLASVPRLLDAAPEMSQPERATTGAPARGRSLHRPVVSSVHAGAATGTRAIDSLPAGLRIPTRLAGDYLSRDGRRDRAGLRPTDLLAPSAASPLSRLAPAQPLQLTLTPAQMRAVLASHQPGATDAMPGPFEEVTVTAAAERAPMRDVSQEVWGGIAAPVWGLLHPTQAWRIFLPIPPR
jgi:hypothetical protein